MRNIKSINSFVSALFLISIALCVPNRAQALYAQDAGHLRWGTPTTGATVPVCYAESFATQPLPAGIDFYSFLDVVRDGAESAWARAANIRFTGWGPCPIPWPASAVVLIKGGDFATAFGGSPAKITLVPSLLMSESGANWRANWKHISAHEFGHVLGFWGHENLRADNYYFVDPTSIGYETTPNGGYVTYGCYPLRGNPDFQTPSTSPPSVFLTYYDHQSIMNPCGEVSDLVNGRLLNERGERTELSAGDVRGAIKAYGKKPTGIYVFNGDPIKKTLPNQSSGFNGLWQQLQFWNSVTAFRQQWVMDGNYCVTSNSNDQGEILWTMACTGTGYVMDHMQRWNIEPSGRIRRSGTNMCVTVQGPPDSGNLLMLYPCQSTPAANEIFSFYPYEIRFGNKCVYNTGSLTLNDCKPAGPSVNQGGMDLGYSVYFFRGQLQTTDGKCIRAFLSADASSPSGQHSWDTQTCQDKPTQIFDTWK